MKTHSTYKSIHTTNTHTHTHRPQNGQSANQNESAEDFNTVIWGSPGLLQHEFLGLETPTLQTEHSAERITEWTGEKVRKERVS